MHRRDFIKTVLGAAGAAAGVDLFDRLLDQIVFTGTPHPDATIVANGREYRIGIDPGAGPDSTAVFIIDSEYGHGLTYQGIPIKWSPSLGV